MCVCVYQFSLVTQSCPALCDPQGLEHNARLPCPSPSPGAGSHSRHWVSDVLLPSGPLSPSPPAFNLSQHQSFLMSRLFAYSGPSMEFQLQHQSF